MVLSPSKVGVGMWGKVGAVVIGLLCGMWYFQDNQLDTLKDKRVLITGASTGIGEQIAYHYARLGAKVAVTSRRLEALQKVAKRCGELSAHNYTHHAIAGDMSDLGSTQHVIEQAISKLGGLDILVLNHILPQDIKPFQGNRDNLTLFDKIIDVNFRSYVHLTSHALAQLELNKGSIIVVNSLMGKIPHPYLHSYSSSKYALHGFFASLRSQFLALGQDVSVTLCTLGLIGTDSALKQLQASGSDRVLSSLSPASPADTGLAIVTAGANRQDEMFYPYFSTRPMVFLRNIFPQAGDAIVRYVVRMQMAGGETEKK